MGANTRLRTLSDLCRHGFNLATRCQCGHASVIDAEAFHRLCMARCWNNNLEGLGVRLRCRACGGRPDGLRPTKAPADTKVGPATETGWKRLVRRLR